MKGGFENGMRVTCSRLRYQLKIQQRPSAKVEKDLEDPDCVTAAS